ncbi:MAG: hypothetical protein WAM66_14030 [Acidobacteriaceae bacterium]
MQAFKTISGLALAAAVVATLVTGCETGRYNKRHPHFVHASDVTTTGHPNPALAANPEGQPPVPDSPTAAGVDGKQPFNDNEARSTPGVEHGRAASPNRNHPDSFKGQNR